MENNFNFTLGCTLFNETFGDCSVSISSEEEVPATDILYSDEEISTEEETESSQPTDPCSSPMDSNIECNMESGSIQIRNDNDDEEADFTDPIEFDGF